MRPGLIEAVDQGRPIVLSGPTIRGVCAPASLKRLIIADALPFGVAIRGVCAPASLKLRTWASAIAFISSYPGRMRPGLIEAHLHGVVVRRRADYPGRMRPGLIEARPRARRLPTCCPPIRGVCAPASLKLGHAECPLALIIALSGAYAPRPH